MNEIVQHSLQLKRSVQMNIMKFGPWRRRGRLGLTKMSAPSSNFETWATKVEDFVSDVRLRLFRVETRLDHVDIRLDKIDARLDKIDARLDKIDARLEQMTASFYKEINNLTLRLVTFVCGFGTALVTATYFVVTHVK
jgi:tetrahydromethanopterin S-methyltransferase subunit G